MAAWDWPAATIIAVIDGDTVDANVTRDLGFGAEARFPVRLRLHGINTPSAKTTAGRAAKTRLTQLLPTGATVHITTHKPYKYGGPVDACGEWMATITLPDGRDISTTLIAERHAVPWDGNGPRPADR